MKNPIPFRWNGEAFEPMAGWRKACDRELVIGQDYLLEEVQERSAKSHDHMFAEINELWKNLPEALSEQFPTTHHLRKKALIETGHFDETVIDCGTKAAALRVAAFIASEDTFAHVVTRGAIVVKRTAKSQSVRAMGREEFQRSKDDVLSKVAEIVGVDVETSRRETGRAA